MRELVVARLGRCEYLATVAVQEELVGLRRAGRIPDVLLLLEHEPVVTVGRGTFVPPPGILRVPVVETSRGGQATYHGPGQLVAYPILDLRQWRTDLHWYLRQLEDAGIQTVRRLGLNAGNQAGHTGVWTDNRKLASIGVAVRGWVTYHGLALNVDCDLRGFTGFDPCGLPPETMVSLRECGVEASLADVAEGFVQAFQGLFSYDKLTILPETPEEFLPLTAVATTICGR